MISLEQKILAYCSDVRSDPRRLNQLRRLIPEVKDVDHLIDTAVREGLAGFLYRALSKSEVLATLDPEHQERLRSLYYRTVLINTRLIHDLKEVLSQLNQKKIRVVLLKGIALLHQPYDDIGLRAMTDIDLWVLKKDYSALINVLSNVSYQRDSIYPSTFRKGNTTLDILTDILWDDRIEAWKPFFARSQDQIYHDARIIDFEGYEALCLNPYDQVIYLGLHALKHNVSSLMWLVDIRNLVTDLDKSQWEGLMVRAEELGQREPLSYVLFLLFNLFDFKAPRETRKLLERNRINFPVKRILKRRINGGPLPIWATIVLFSPGKGLRVRLYFIIETLFPRPEILRQVFPDSLELKPWHLYLKRAFQLLGMLKMPRPQ
jgi:hypothetical protein